MKPYNEFVNESLIDGEEWKEIADEINTLWAKKSNGGFSTFNISPLGTDSIIGKMYIRGSSTGEHNNNILDNDPLNVVIHIKQMPDKSFVIEPTKKFAFINPESKYYAYSFHKFKLRKTKAKDRADLLKKMEKNFVDRIVADVKTLLKDGQFEVHANSSLRVGGTVLDLIKKRYK